MSARRPGGIIGLVSPSSPDGVRAPPELGAWNLGRGGVEVAVRDADSRVGRRPLARPGGVGPEGRHLEGGVPGRPSATDIDLASAIVRKLKEEQAMRAAAEANAAAARIEVAGLRAEISQQREQIATVSAAAAEATAAADIAAAAARTEMKRLRGELLQYKRQLAQEADSAQAAAAAARGEAGKLQTDLARFRDKLADSEAAEAAAAANAQYEIDSLSSELSQCRSQIETHTAAIEASTASAQAAAAAVEAELRDRVNRLATELAEAQLRAEQLGEENAKHKGNTERAEQRAARACDQIDEVTKRYTKELHATRQMAATYEVQAAEAQRACSELSKELDRVVAATAQVGELKTLDERSVPAFREVLTSQTAAQVTANQTIAQIEAALHASQLERDQLRRELERERSVSASTKSRAIKSESEITELMASSAQAVEAAQQTALDERARAVRCETEYSRLQMELSSITEEVDRLKAAAVANGALQEEVEHLRAQSIERDMAALEGNARTQVMELKASLQDRTEEVSRLSQHVDGLLKDKMDMQAMLSQLRTRVSETEALQVDVAELRRQHEQELRLFRREHADAKDRDAESHAVVVRSLQAKVITQSDEFEASRTKYEKALAGAHEELVRLRDQTAADRERLHTEHEAARERLLAEQQAARGRIEADCTETLSAAAAAHAAYLAVAERNAEQLRTSRIAAEASAAEAHEIEMTNVRRSHATALANVGLEREAERVRLTEAHTQCLALLEAGRTEQKEAIRELRESRDAETARLTAAHEADIAHLTEQHKSVLAGLSAEQQERVAAMESLRRQHSQNLVAVDARHVAAIENLNATHRNALSRQASEYEGSLQTATAQHNAKTGELMAANTRAIQELKAAHARILVEVEDTWQARLTETAREHHSAEEEQEAAAAAALGILGEQQARLLDLQQTSIRQAKALEAMKLEHAQQIEAASQREAKMRQERQDQEEGQEAELLQRDAEAEEIGAALAAIAAERTRLEGDVEAWRAQSVSLRAELVAVRGSEGALQKTVVTMFGQVAATRLQRLHERKKRRLFLSWASFSQTHAAQTRLRTSRVRILGCRFLKMRARATFDAWCWHRLRRRVVQQCVLSCLAARRQQQLRAVVLCWRRRVWLSCISRRCSSRKILRTVGRCLYSWATLAFVSQLQRKADVERGALTATVEEQQARYELEVQQQRAAEVAAVQASRDAGQRELVEANEAALHDAKLRAAEAEAAMTTLRKDNLRQQEEFRDACRTEAMQMQRSLEAKLAKHAAGREAAKYDAETARHELVEAARRFDKEVILSWEEIARLRGVEAENAELRAEVEELSSISLTVGQLRPRSNGVTHAMPTSGHAATKLSPAASGNWWKINGSTVASVSDGVAGVVAGAAAVAAAGVGATGFKGNLPREAGGGQRIDATDKFRRPPPHPRLGAGRNGSGAGID